MKKILLSISTLLFLATSLTAQNKALKISTTEEEPVYNITHIEESPNLAAYRGDNDPDSSMVVNVNGPWTVEVWVKPEVLGKSYLLLSGGNTQFRLQHFDSDPGEWWGGDEHAATSAGLGTLGYFESLELDDVFGTPGFHPEVGEWQHLAVISDEWSIRLVVNGEEEHYITAYHNQDENYTGFDAMAWGIGDNETGWMATANCELDNYRVWDKAREVEDILADMKKNTPSNTDGLIANYTFDNDEEGKVINVAGETRNMLFNEESVAAVSYVESGAPIDPSEYEKEGIMGQRFENLKVYPNPATNVINIQGAINFDSFTVDIMDTTGKLIHKSNVKGNQVNLPSLNSGIYLLKIADASKVYIGRISIL